MVPSEWYENYPFSCLEAMAYGKPVIASRIGGIPEQVEDGVTGFLFEPFNHEELAQKILELYQLKDDELTAMGKQARKKVERVNNPQAYLEKILPLYRDLIEKHNLRRPVRSEEFTGGARFIVCGIWDCRL